MNVPLKVRESLGIDRVARDRPDIEIGADGTVGRDRKRAASKSGATVVPRLAVLTAGPGAIGVVDCTVGTSIPGHGDVELIERTAIEPPKD